VSGDLSQPVLLVGAGPMARAYVEVLLALGVSPQVVGRSRASAESLTASTGVPVIEGGIEAWLAQAEAPPPRSAIVASSVDQLFATTMALLRAGCSNVLVEKPAALRLDELDELVKVAEQQKAQVWVGYNRRFLASVIAAQEIVDGDGGITSFAFEFTEVANRVAATDHPESVKQAWLLANSSHVIDLAFYLGGGPADLHPRKDGRLEWHPAGARFAGCGVSRRGALFTYLADWEAPGGWGVDLRTRFHLLRLRPLETLSLQRHGSFDTEQVPLDDSLDSRFKPGLYRQTQAFLGASSGSGGALPGISEHRDLVRDAIVRMTAG
jgi:hypothetical protein